MPTVIVGGGFTGLFTALRLHQLRYPQQAVLIDREEQFAFKPLLYELLSGEMDPHQVIPRFEELLAGTTITFVHDSVEAIDLNGRQVSLTSGLRYHYDRLVLAVGSVGSYDAKAEGAAEHSFGFRTAEEVMQLKRHLRRTLQRASQTDESEERRRLLTIVVAGAGPTGLELAATLADWLPGRYAELGGEPGEIRVVLIHRSGEILQGDMNENLRRTVRMALPRRRVPVELVLEAEVMTIGPEAVQLTLRDGSRTIPTATCVWTAGTAVHPLLRALAVSPEHRDRRGRLVVTPTLQLPEYPEVFAGGDCTVLAQEALPAIAQVAYQQGFAIARNLKALAEGQPTQPAQVHLRGTLMKLGLGEAAAELFDRYEIKGRPGHLVRQARYLELLPAPAHNFKATAEWLTDALFQRLGRGES